MWLEWIWIFLTMSMLSLYFSVSDWRENRIDFQTFREKRDCATSKTSQHRSQVTFSHLIRAHRISFHFSSSLRLWVFDLRLSIIIVSSKIVQDNLQFSLSVMFHVERVESYWERKFMLVQVHISVTLLHSIASMASQAMQFKSSSSRRRNAEIANK